MQNLTFALAAEEIGLNVIGPPLICKFDGSRVIVPSGEDAVVMIA